MQHSQIQTAPNRPTKPSWSLKRVLTCGEFPRSCYAVLMPHIVYMVICLFPRNLITLCHHKFQFTASWSCYSHYLTCRWWAGCVLRNCYCTSITQIVNSNGTSHHAKRLSYSDRSRLRWTKLVLSSLASYNAILCAKNTSTPTNHSCFPASDNILLRWCSACKVTSQITWSLTVLSSCPFYWPFQSIKWLSCFSKSSCMKIIMSNMSRLRTI